MKVAKRISELSALAEQAEVVVDLIRQTACAVAALRLTCEAESETPARPGTEAGFIEIDPDIANAAQRALDLGIEKIAVIQASLGDRALLFDQSLSNGKKALLQTGGDLPRGRREIEPLLEPLREVQTGLDNAANEIERGKIIIRSIGSSSNRIASIIGSLPESTT